VQRKVHGVSGKALLGSAGRQRGVALIMAMMIVALIAVISVEVSWRFELGMSRSANRWHGMQARAYLAGAEHLAMVVLKQDSEDEEGSRADHKGETWAQESEPFPTDHGWVKGVIEDAHGRFNINRMQPEPDTCGDGNKKNEQGICPPPESQCDRYMPAQRQFIRLLQTVNVGTEEEPLFLEASDAELIAEAVIDWLDFDSEIRGFGGAESDYYEQLTPPTTIANTEMISVSELQVIKGMTPALYQKLLPLVIALPKDEAGVVNINTAKAEVIRTLTPAENCDLLPMPEEDANAIVQIIENGAFTEVQQLADDPALPASWLDSNQNLALEPDSATIIQSTYFLFYSEAAVGEDHIRRGQSLIKRTAGTDSEDRGAAQAEGVQIEVVRRTDANF